MDNQNKELLEHFVFMAKCFSYILFCSVITALILIIIDIEPINAYRLTIGAAIFGALIGIVKVLKRMNWL